MADGASAADAHRLLAERIDAGLPLAPAAGPRARLLILLADGDPYAAEFAGVFPEDRGVRGRGDAR